MISDKIKFKIMGHYWFQQKAIEMLMLNIGPLFSVIFPIFPAIERSLLFHSFRYSKQCSDAVEDIRWKDGSATDEIDQS